MKLLLASLCHLSLAVLAFLAFGANAAAQISERMIIDRNAVCRTEPKEDAEKVRVYFMGELAEISKQSQQGAITWYFDMSHYPFCWVYGPWTAAHSDEHPERALVAAIDYVLRRSKEAKFEDYVATENLLKENQKTVDASGLVQFRELQLIDAAISQQNGYVFGQQPLVAAWFLSHENVIDYWEIGQYWYIPPEIYWNLHDKHKQEPWAEELAWTAARASIPSDECYADCILDKIDRTYLKYWTRYPRGPRIKEALAAATSMAKYASDYACTEGFPYVVSRPILDKMHNSLDEVVVAQKYAFLRYINQMIRACYSDNR